VVRESAIIEKVAQIAMPILSEMELELVDIEYRREGAGWVLRLFIDRLDSGVSLDDCVDVSRELGSHLEVEDPISTSYRLEVSSPGLDRPLKKPSDFHRFKGRRVKLKTVEKMDPDRRGYERKTFVGTLLGMNDGAVSLLQLDKKGGEVTFLLDQIEKANLDPEF